MIWSRAYKTLSEIPREMNASFLSIPEAVRLSTVPDRDIRVAISNGELRIFNRFNGRKLIRVDSFRAWISARTVSIERGEKPIRKKRTYAIEYPRETKLKRLLEIARKPCVLIPSSSGSAL